MSETPRKVEEWRCWREEATAALAVIREAGRLKEADQPE